MTEAVESTSAPAAGSKKVRRALFPLIDKPFQVKVTAFFVFLILMSHVFLLWLHYRHLQRVQTFSATNAPVGIQRIVNPELVAGVVGIAFVVGLVVFFLTQKVSGPLYAMSKAMKEFKEGNLDRRVKLRKADELKWFADDLNATLENVSEKIRSKGG